MRLPSPQTKHWGKSVGVGDGVDGPTDVGSMDCKVGLDVGRPSFVDAVGL